MQSTSSLSLCGVSKGKQKDCSLLRIILLRDNLSVLWDKARLLCRPCFRRHQFLHEKPVETDDKFFGSLNMGVQDIGKVWLQAETSSTSALRLLLCPFSSQSSCPAVTSVTADNRNLIRKGERKTCNTHRNV